MSVSSRLLVSNVCCSLVDPRSRSAGNNRADTESGRYQDNGASVTLHWSVDSSHQVDVVD